MELASIIAIITGAAVLIALLVYLLKPKTESLFSARITQPLTVSARFPGATHLHKIKPTVLRKTLILGGNHRQFGIAG